MFLRVIAAIAICLCISISSFAGTESSIRAALDQSKYDQVVALVNGKDLKTAEDLYLLGQALYKLGKSRSAHEAWTKCIKQNKEAGGKYEFLFAPGKKLTAAEKKALYNTFMKTYKSLNAAVIFGLQNTAKSATRDASQKLVDAST